MLCTGDPKLEVKEESRQGLRFPLWNPDITQAEYNALIPDFDKLSAKIYKLFNTPLTKVDNAQYVGSFTSEAYTYILEFLRALLIKTADCSAQIEIGNITEERCKIKKASTREAVMTLIKNSFNDMETEEVSGVRAYTTLIQYALESKEVDSLLQSVASSCLIELISLCPVSFSISYSENLTWMKVS